MDVEPSIQTINGMVRKKKNSTNLLTQTTCQILMKSEPEDPNEFRIRDPLPEYREYKRKLSEVHSMRASFLCSGQPF
jgi:hypothetical protein